MKDKGFIWLGVLMLLWGAGFAQAAINPEEIMAKVQAQYDKSTGLKTRFHQESRLKAVNHADTAEGWMYFQKPSRMRWQYESPPEQKKELISDGKQVWMYIPQDSLVMIYPVNQVLRSDLVMRFFSGMGQFQKDFRISWRQPPELGKPYVIDCLPRQPQPELKVLTLTIHPRTFMVEKLEFTNAVGEETRFTFTQSQLDVRLAPDFFTFVPPPGVQVVREGKGS